MKISHNKAILSGTPHAKYKSRLADLDQLRIMNQGFVKGQNCRNCLMCTKDRAGQEECLAEVIRTQWPEPFGNTHYCLSPDIKKFVELANSVLARFDERTSRRAGRTPSGCCA